LREQRNHDNNYIVIILLDMGMKHYTERHRLLWLMFDAAVMWVPTAWTANVWFLWGAGSRALCSPPRRIL